MDQPNQSQPTEQWEIDLRKMFSLGYIVPKSMLREDGGDNLCPSFESVRDFIRTQINQAREQARREIIEEVRTQIDVSTQTNQLELLGTILEITLNIEAGKKKL